MFSSRILSVVLCAVAVSPWKIPQFNHDRANEYQKIYEYQHGGVNNLNPSIIQKSGSGEDGYVAKAIPGAEYGRSMREPKVNPTVPPQVIKVLKTWLQSISRQSNNKHVSHSTQKPLKPSDIRKWKIPSEQITKKPHSNKIYELKTHSTTLSPQRQREKANLTRDFVIINDKETRDARSREESENYIPYRLSKRSVPANVDAEKLYNAIQSLSKEDLKFALSKMDIYRTEENEPKCCFNGGTCYKKNGESWCHCPPQFTGRLCFDDVNECANNASICPPHSSCLNHHGSYNCVCHPRFVKEGKDCIPQTTCEEDPCLNGALCVNKKNEGSFVCICELGFQGERCEHAIPECDDFPCADNEICVSTPKGFECLSTI